jgi:hypothetical protein
VIGSSGQLAQLDLARDRGAGVPRGLDFAPIEPIRRDCDWHHDSALQPGRTPPGGGAARTRDRGADCGRGAI